jgi:hypothetical protein
MEIWKDIESASLEFDYQVSNFGNVRSLNYNRTGKVKNLQVRYSPTNARQVLLAGKIVRSIAQLVLNHFGEPRPSDKHFSHHKDGNILNDCIENLEWRHISVQNAINSKNGSRHRKEHASDEQSKGLKPETDVTESPAHNETDTSSVSA